MESEFEAVAANVETSGGLLPPGMDWSTVVHRYDGRLRCRVRRVLCRVGIRAHPELVDELMQEIYCRLLEAGASRLRRCRAGTEPELIAYIGIVAEHLILDRRRLALALKRSGLDTVRLGRLGRRTRRAVESLADPGPTPEEVFLRRERQRLLLDRCRRLRGLGSGRRNAWIMRMAVLEGYSSHEIAAAAGGRLAPSTVDTLVHRIRRRLRGRGLEVPHR